MAATLVAPRFYLARSSMRRSRWKSWRAGRRQPNGTHFERNGARLCRTTKVGWPFQADPMKNRRRFECSRQARKPDLRVFRQSLVLLNRFEVAQQSHQAGLAKRALHPLVRAPEVAGQDSLEFGGEAHFERRSAATPVDQVVRQVWV